MSSVNRQVSVIIVYYWIPDKYNNECDTIQLLIDYQIIPSVIKLLFMELNAINGLLHA